MAAPVAPIQQPPPFQPVGIYREGLCSKLKALTEIIVQTAIRVLFIAATILMAAAALPLKFHAMVIPVVAFGSTVLAGFFFPQPTRLAPPRFDPLPPLLRPVAPRPIVPAVPAGLAQEAPRPLVNIGQNCAFNSLVHFFESDPVIAQWFRHPLTADMEMPAFENFLAGYQPPAQVVAKFREYVNNPANPRAPIPAMFKAFVDGHVPDNDYATGFRSIKNTYNDLLLLQGPFANFFADYDQAVLENRPVGKSQDLRLALNRISETIDPSEGEQMDAAEPLDLVLDLLPHAQKTKVAETYHYDTRGLPPLAGIPDAIGHQEHRHGTIQLSIRENEAATTVDKLLQYYCDDPTVIEKKSVDGKNRPYPTTVRRQFLEAPSVLRFQIKRYINEKLADSWLTKLKLFFWPDLGQRMVKRDTPVQVPQDLTITLANGERKQYRLTSFVNHHGATPRSGHYTACRIINGRKYLMSDDQVTLEDPRWDAYLPQAYLLCYLPVQA